MPNAIKRPQVMKDTMKWTDDNAKGNAKLSTTAIHLFININPTPDDMLPVIMVAQAIINVYDMLACDC